MSLLQEVQTTENEKSKNITEKLLIALENEDGKTISSCIIDIFKQMMKFEDIRSTCFQKYQKTIEEINKIQNITTRENSTNLLMARITKDKEIKDWIIEKLTIEDNHEIKNVRKLSTNSGDYTSYLVTNDSNRIKLKRSPSFYIESGPTMR